MKEIFSGEDPMGHAHLEKVGKELEKHGSKEKTGFIEKEAEFIKRLKGV